MRIRKLHLYLGALCAPAIVFFAISGALQTFGLHEAKAPSTYTPPHWIATLAEVHKNQRFEKPAVAEHGDASKPKREANASALPEAMHVRASVMALKIWFLVTAVALITTSVLGVIMAFRYNGDKRLVTALLLLGLVIPFVLLVL
jgi:hypothetical protein